jgi:glycosidase
MPWADGTNAGFSSGRPWLRMAADSATRNVARQAADPSSVLSTYRRLIWLRREHPALQTGSYRRLAASRDVFAYLRAGSGETVLVAVNFGRAPGWVRLEGHPASGAWAPLFGTHATGPRDQPDGARVELGPLEAVLWRAT